MTNHSLVLPIILSACASAHPLVVDSDRATPSHVEIIPKTSDDMSARARLAPVDPRLPSADQIAPRIRYHLGETAAADVRLCVSPRGQVVAAELEHGSSLPAYDQAVMKDVTAWTFPMMPGPPSLRTCARFTVTYRPS